MRLSKHLQALGLSNAEAKRAMASGKVFLRGLPTSDGGRDVDPDTVELRPAAPKIVPGRDLVILHNDAEMVVVYKPAGLLAVPAGKAGGHLNVVGLVGKLTGTGLAVHRLDQQCSGLMMVAKTQAAQMAIKAQLEVHSVTRRYFALASGTPRHTKWTINNYLIRNRGDGLRGAAKGTPPADARNAITHFECLQKVGKRNTLVRATLQTGRTHQVRIHLSECRNAILGDDLYAPFPIARAAARLALHAYELGLDHPRTGKRLHFQIPLADDMEQLRRHYIFEASKPPEEHQRSAKKKARKKKRR
jgi:23S rRNA pseudouridine1911/1915/1917 synthase